MMQVDDVVTEENKLGQAISTFPLVATTTTKPYSHNPSSTFTTMQQLLPPLNSQTTNRNPSPRVSFVVLSPLALLLSLLGPAIATRRTSI
jgi:hypothetical protein